MTAAETLTADGRRQSAVVVLGADCDDGDRGEDDRGGIVFANADSSLTGYMTTDNDGESAGSSSCSGCPSPSMPKKHGKGILVHKNKKPPSAGNRVSFACSRPTTASSSSSLSTSSGRRIRPSTATPEPNVSPPPRRVSCFGVKSHLHEFYDSPDHALQDDDFRYLVEPRSRCSQHCCSVSALFGLAVMSVGAVTLAAGHLIPAKDPIVGRSANLEVVDRWAVTYNQNLVACRYAGAVVFGIGVVFTVIRLWVSLIRSSNQEHWIAEQKLGVKNDGVAKQNKQQQQPQTVRIPITGLVQGVQPKANVAAFGDGR
ncbi:neurensin-1-like isoform X2 [Adelges cooleyi]|nr:neurensin-1-like isoform X2 [Adelges cooleyi]XP_050421223.1 neurensin-1-like isoform X2 [Adelges cooleyi]